MIQNLNHRRRQKGIISFFIVWSFLVLGCAGQNSKKKASDVSAEIDPNAAEIPMPTMQPDETENTLPNSVAESGGSAKIDNPDCVDPDLDRILSTEVFTLCDGTIGTGALDITQISTNDITSEVTIGSLSGSLINCGENFTVGCIANSFYQGISPINLLAKNIKKNVVVAGLTGTYPSVGNLLTGSDTTADLSLIENDRKLQFASAVNFEWFLSDGSRALAAGDVDLVAENIVTGKSILGVPGNMNVPNPDAWDLCYGVHIGSVTGKLKVNCKSLSHSSYDKADGLSTGISGTDDPFSTIDDYAGDGTTVPLINPWGDNSGLCGYLSIPLEERTWEQVVTNPVTSGSDAVFKDKISGLKWTRYTAGGNYFDDPEGTHGAGTGALEYCESLSHGGIDTWRVPTNRELFDAYAHGIHDLSSVHSVDDNLGNLESGAYFSSSTTDAQTTTAAKTLSIMNGKAISRNKHLMSITLCVSP